MVPHFAQVIAAHASARGFAAPCSFSCRRTRPGAPTAAWCRSRATLLNGLWVRQAQALGGRLQSWA
eukprot:9890040-Alexandrium_andersonii.AAC.1